MAVTAENMLAGDLMSTPLLTAGPNDFVQDVAEIMATHHISAIVIQENPREPAFLITSGDIIRWIAQHPEGVKGVHAHEIMHGPVTPVRVGDTIAQVIQLMYDRGFKRVVVQNDAGAFVGLITIRDIIGWDFAHFGPSQPLMLLTIFKESGVVLSQYQFPNEIEFDIRDVDLLGSSMSAISTLLGEMLETTGDLKVIREENYVIMIEFAPHILGVLIADNVVGLLAGHCLMVSIIN